MVGRTTMMLVGNRYLPLSWKMNTALGNIIRGEDKPFTLPTARSGTLPYSREKYWSPIRKEKDLTKNAFLLSQVDGAKIHIYGSQTDRRGIIDLIASQGLRILVGQKYMEYAITGGDSASGQVKATIPDRGTIELRVDGNASSSKIEMSRNGDKIEMKINGGSKITIEKSSITMTAGGKTFKLDNTGVNVI